MAPSCCSVLSSFCFIFGDHTHDDTQDVIVHFFFSELVAIPLLCGFCLVLVLLWFCVFCCLFALCLLVFSFDGTAHWTVYWSITSAFEAIDV